MNENLFAKSKLNIEQEQETINLIDNNFVESSTQNENFLNSQTTDNSRPNTESSASLLDISSPDHTGSTLIAKDDSDQRPNNTNTLSVDILNGRVYHRQDSQTATLVSLLENSTDPNEPTTDKDLSLIDLTKENDSDILIIETKSNVNTNIRSSIPGTSVISQLASASIRPTMRHFVRKIPVSMRQLPKKSEPLIQDLNEDSDVIIQDVVRLTRTKDASKRARQRTGNDSENNADINITITIDDEKSEATSSMSAPSTSSSDIVNIADGSSSLQSPPKRSRKLPKPDASTMSILNSILPQNTASAHTVESPSQTEILNDFRNVVTYVKSKAESQPKPSTSQQPNFQCKICLENFDELTKRNRKIMSTNCGHIFCNMCLDEYFKKSAETAGRSKSDICPVCRAKLTKSKIHPVYF